MSTQRIWTTDGEGSNGTAQRKSGNNHIDDIPNPYLIGVQSRFRRRYYHKSIFILLLVIILILLVTVVVIACLLHFPPTVCHSAECLRSAADLKQSMDLTADPCEDFYRFTCGNWEEDHPRPDAYTSFDWFSERQARILRNIRQYLQANGSEQDPRPVAQARIMYRACMNISAMDSLGYAPIFKYLEQFHLPAYPTILNLTEVNYDTYRFDWIRSLAKIKQLLGMDILVGFDVYPDPRHRDYNRLVLGTPESGSDLPFNTDILRHIRKRRRPILVSVDESTESNPSSNGKNDDDSGSKADQSQPILAYKKFMIGVMKILVNETEARGDLDSFADSFSKAADVQIDFTEAIAKFAQEAENASKSSSVEDRLNLQDIVYCTVSDLQNLTDSYLLPKDPLPVWEKFVNMVFDGIPEAQLNLKDEMLLTSNADVLYLKLLVEYLADVPLAHIELYIWWSVVEELILHTTMEIRKLHYEYYRAIAQAEGFGSRTLYCTGTVNRLLGMAVSYAISDESFIRETKPRVQSMLQYIRIAFDTLVRDTTWMDWPTKDSTLKKSNAMRSLIGFPEWILNVKELDTFYEGLNVAEGTHLENMMEEVQRQNIIKLRRWRLKHELNWETLPTNVNAFHTFQENAITIPIAILQYPFYHLGLEALNYGAIGTILGHELTHGFDDSGRQFDKNGNLLQWWTNATVQEYVNRTICFVNQYGRYYIPEAEDYIDGLLTLGENIADNGGVREAYRAYKLYVKNNGKEPLLPGFENFTHEQLFFIAYGNIWCESHTQAAAKAYLDDSHCPGKFRLKGVLTNSPEFSQTFGCRRGTEMNPSADKCRIW